MSLQKLGFIIMSESGGKGLPLVAFRLNPAKKHKFDEVGKPIWVALSLTRRSSPWRISCVNVAGSFRRTRWHRIRRI